MCFCREHITFKAIAELSCVSEQHSCLASEWIHVLNESCEPMIQSPIHRAIYWIPEQISRLNESNESMTHKDIYHHLLADLVSYLQY